MRPGLLTLSACLAAASPVLAQHPAPPVAPLVAPAPSAAALAAVPDLGCTPGGVGCAAAPRTWARAEYLLWFINGIDSPELIQSVPSALAAAGGTGLPPGASTSLFPDDERIKFDGFNGVRLSGGYDLGGCGLEASGFVLESRSESGALFNTGMPVSAGRQYFNAATGESVVLYSSLADQYAGGVAAFADSQFWGAEINLRAPFYSLFADYNDLLLGFRFLNLAESISIISPAYFQNGSSLVVQDIIRTRNRFYGAQVGVRGAFVPAKGCGLGFDWAGKFAFGGVRQIAELSGTNTYTLPDGTIDPQQGGLYAQGANQGRFERDKCAAAAEFDVNLSYHFSEATRVFIGYSAVWISSVQRPGAAIDPLINESNTRFIADPAMSTANRPAFRFRGDDFVAQGLNVGLQFQY